MQSLALDTNAYTALGRGNKTLASLITEVVHVGLPIIVLGEIRFGILNGTHGKANSNLLEQFLSNDRVEVLDINENTTQLYGEIATGLRRLGRPVQQNDIWIAALCKQYNYKLATSDAGFDNILGLEIVNF
jgi:predicted nucleic acid-binding protein